MNMYKKIQMAKTAILSSKHNISADQFYPPEIQNPSTNMLEGFLTSISNKNHLLEKR